MKIKIHCPECGRPDLDLETDSPVIPEHAIPAVIVALSSSVAAPPAAVTLSYQPKCRASRVYLHVNHS